MNGYVLAREWQAGIRHRPLLTVLVVLLAACGIAGAAVLCRGRESAARWWESRFTEPQVEVFLDTTMTDDSARRLTGELALLSPVVQARFVSAAEARQEAEAYLGSLAFTVLPENPLPPSIRVTLREAFRTPHQTRRLADSLIALPGISEVVSAEEQVFAYTAGRRALAQYRRALLGTGAVWTLGWLFFGLHLMLRLRSNQARIWSMLGVPPGWLRWPPVLEGLILGGCAAVIGWLLMHPAADILLKTPGRMSDGAEFGMLFLMPPVIGVLAGWLAYRAHRRPIVAA